jgi:hypothetical protein
MQIRAMGAEFSHAQGRRGKHEEANSCFSQFWGKCVKPCFYFMNSVACVKYGRAIGLK